MRDQWWKRQFRRMLALEESGLNPITLQNRYLLLASRTRDGQRWKVSFEVPNNVYHFLDDADIRTKDTRYGEHQWQIASEWLNG